ncbi:MAG TPA: DUF2283 domain-containing protein [Syntrophorhabdaceae bacterium]|nr:DUF2283 domain-containing protein [Syntrophorhabdaceae bacterium]
MRIEYDDQNDTIYFRLSNSKIEDSESLLDADFVVSYDRERSIIGLKIQDASKNELFEKLILAAIASLRETATEDQSFDNIPRPLSCFSVSDTGE